MINISYIAPITDYKFDNSSFYYLIITYCDNSNNMFIYKILIKNLNNVNKVTRAYLVNKSVNINKSSIITLFELDRDSKLKLLFIGNINPDNNNQIILDWTIDKKVVNYNDITSFLQEIHYDYEKISTDNKCIIFLNKIKMNNIVTVEPFKIIINDYYSYEPRLNIYIKKNNYLKNHKNSVLRKLEITNYDADIMTAPIDGIYYLEDNNIIIYTRKQDYPVFYSPYEARLVNIKQQQDKLILDFETNYFMPKSVHERSLLSVVNGNYTYGGMGVGIDSRNYPETLEPQPDTKLHYRIIIINNLNNINHELKINTNYIAGDVLIKKINPDTKIIISTNMLFKTKYECIMNNFGVKLRSNSYMSSIDYKKN